MSNDTTLGLFANFLARDIFPVITSWLKENKKCDVSVQELVDVLGMPVKPTAAPSYLTALGKPTTAAKPRAKPANTGMKCGHKFTKVTKTGKEFCDKNGTQEEGDPYPLCTSHRKVYANKNTKPAPTTQVTTPAVPEQQGVDADEFWNSKAWFRMTGKDLIIREDEKLNIVIVGAYDDKTNKFRAFNSTEDAFIKKERFIVDNKPLTELNEILKERDPDAYVDEEPVNGKDESKDSKEELKENGDDPIYSVSTEEDEPEEKLEVKKETKAETKVEYRPKVVKKEDPKPEVKKEEPKEEAKEDLYPPEPFEEVPPPKESEIRAMTKPPVIGAKKLNGGGLPTIGKPVIPGANGKRTLPGLTKKVTNI